MPPLKTPICDFGTNAKNFKLNSTDNKLISLNDIKGDASTLIMFICNHCPYVKAVIKDIVEDCKNLEKLGIKAVAICSNDSINYPEDSFDKMVKFHEDHNFNFPYLLDETQVIAKNYGAVCTPDFFGYNKNLEELGIKAVAICSNDSINYPDDSFDKMIEFHKDHNFNFPYLIDETQKIAKSYGAVCTPDFFGYNKNLGLQYRGRIRELENLKPIKTGESDLFKAMKQIAETNNGPKDQIPSMGCGIKWLDN